MSEVAKSTENAELEIIRYYEKQQEIVTLYAKGETILDIQKVTGLPRKEVEKHLAEFREYAKQDSVIRERAKEIVLVVDQHYSNIVNDMHKAVDTADMNDDYKVVLSGLKMIADAEAKRVELLAKAGVLADSTIGDQIAEAEKDKQIIIGILKDVTGKCPNCKMKVAKALSEVTKNAESASYENA